MSKQQGKVDIVGAGPGGLAYLTLAGKSLIVQAEVLIYDALIHSEILTLATEDCVRLSVGKRGGQPSTPQDQINQLLVEQCQQGKRVVRLKCGDPFIFGRTAAELQMLKRHGCAAQVWPGLSSVFTAPLLAGIPLTDARLSGSFVVISGHAPDLINWSAVAHIETLVILMGTQTLSTIIEQLLRQGQDPARPIAIIRRGGWPQQQVWVGTLATIEPQIQGEVLSPAVIVVGEVVTLRSSLEVAAPSHLQSAEDFKRVSPANDVLLSRSLSMTDANRPLAGKTVLVTRSASQAKGFCDRISTAGATVLEMPAIEIVPPSDWSELDDAIATLEKFHWLILTSANGVNYFLDRLIENGKDLRSLSHLKIAVVGRKTATTLKERGLQADFIPPSFVADSLVEHFPQQDLRDLPMLFPRVETGGRDVLVAQFKAQGADITEAPAYQSQCTRSISPSVLEALQTRSVDVITFASSKTVQCFCQLLQHTATAAGQNWLQWIQQAQIASIGPQTSATCEQLLGRVDVEASEYTLEGLIQSILDHCIKPEANILNKE
ncbi:Uroporphyrinogen-III C-methyltransferase [Acaryochloris thomasi RCC1774]|uniref:uroporphyrinogen-III C-methyltransferase n=1 Tax=Acaryochloris thomasi RCC1774 TaxID=1764569 RepID=A0A2W1JZ16_9CYAN|nr:uroporphyrinogen-III C-methyltransferase [Acaryochloris thomasi]PZD73731.1 Uroporphyrinogen-III C-methyltransferase [Acaryochloris thomasi RCC1774]